MVVTIFEQKKNRIEAVYFSDQPSKDLTIQYIYQLGSILTQEGIQNLQQISAGCSTQYLSSREPGHVHVPEYFIRNKARLLYIKILPLRSSEFFQKHHSNY